MKPEKKQKKISILTTPVPTLTPTPIPVTPTPIPIENYNKSGQPGLDAAGSINVVNSHKNWGLLRCVAPTNNY